MKTLSIISLLTLSITSTMVQSTEPETEEEKEPETPLQTAPALATTPSSNGNLQGNKLSFNYDVVLVQEDVNSQEVRYCLPRGQEIRIAAYENEKYQVYRIGNIGWTSDADIAKEQKEIATQFGVTLPYLDLTTEEEALIAKFKQAQDTRILCSDQPTAQYLPRQKLITATSNKGGFVPEYANHVGFSYGMLIVPYKYYTNSENYTGSATVAPYVGGRWDWNNVGFEIKPIVFAGPTSLAGIDDSGSSTNLFGLSYGAGLLFDIKNEFNAGVVFGKDIVGKDDRSKFEDDDDWWIAISLGYDFSN